MRRNVRINGMNISLENDKLFIGYNLHAYKLSIARKMHAVSNENNECVYKIATAYNNGCHDVDAPFWAAQETPTSIASIRTQQHNKAFEQIRTALDCYSTITA